MISRNTDPIRDPILSEEVVLSLVRRHVPESKALTAVDESGGEARAYFIDDNVVLKTQRPHRVRPRTSLEKEAFFLRRLDSECPEVVVPRVFGCGKQGNVEYLCMTRMAGVAARRLEIEGEARLEMLRHLGRTLRRVHGVSQAAFFASPLFPGARTRDEFLSQLKAGFDTAIGRIIVAHPTAWLLDMPPETVAETALASVPEHVDLVALHTNPGPEHTYVDPESLAFVGLIDFGDAYIGHPGLDLRWPRWEDRLAILVGYQEEAPLNYTFTAAWRASLILSDMTALMARPERRAQALENLQRLLSEA